MLKLKEIKERLSDMNIRAISKKSNIPHWKIYQALKSTDPKYSIVEKLSDYLETIGD